MNRYKLALVGILSAIIGCGSGETLHPVDAGVEDVIVEPVCPKGEDCDGGAPQHDSGAPTVLVLGTPIFLADGSGTVVMPGGIVPAGNGCNQIIDIPKGSVIKSVAFAIRPGPHAKITGIGLPFIAIRREDINGKVTDFSEPATDTSVSAAEYDVPHSIVVSPLPIPTDGALFYLYFSQEAGGGAAVDGSVVGATVTYLPPMD